MLKSKIRLLAILCLVLFVVTFPARAQNAQNKGQKEKKVYNGTPVLWLASEDIESRNLLLVRAYRCTHKSFHNFNQG